MCCDLTVPEVTPSPPIAPPLGDPIRRLRAGENKVGYCFSSCAPLGTLVLPPAPKALAPVTHPSATASVVPHQLSSSPLQAWRWQTPPPPRSLHPWGLSAPHGFALILLSPSSKCQFNGAFEKLPSSPGASIHSPLGPCGPALLTLGTRGVVQCL